MKGEEPGLFINTEQDGSLFGDLSGRDYWKKTLGSYRADEAADDVLNLSGVQALLLYGPFGSGKSALLRALAGELVQVGYQYLEMDLSRIRMEDFADLLKEIYDKWLIQGACYLYLLHLELLKNTEAEVLLEFCKKAVMEDKKLILTATAENVEELAPDIRRFFDAYYVGCPDTKDRKAFFDARLNRMFTIPSTESMDLLAENTEGYNYYQLEALVSQVKHYIKQFLLSGKGEAVMQVLNPDSVKAVLERQPKSSEKEPSGGGVHMEELMILLQKLETQKPVAGNMPEPEAKRPGKPEKVDPLAAFMAEFAPE